MNSAAARLVECAARPPKPRDRRLREPDRQAPTLAQGSIVFGPICHPAPLFGDMVTASSIGFERHRGSRVTEGVVLLRQPSPHTNRPIRATNLLHAPAYHPSWIQQWEEAATLW